MAKLDPNQIKQRYLRECLFQWAGRLAIAFSLLCLVGLLGSVMLRSLGAFTVYHLKLEVSQAQYLAQGSEAVVTAVQEQDASLTARDVRSVLSLDFSSQLAAQANAAQGLSAFTVRLVLSDTANKTLRQHIETPNLSAATRRWLDQAEASGLVYRAWNRSLFTQGNSSFAISAGLWGALKGSLLAILVAVIIAFPIGLAAAVYLQEFAPTNRWTSLIELNINNLVAVPSILYGLLGLALYVNWLGVPRAVPFIAGLVLALMMLPVVIITSRAALHAVPDEVRMAAVGVGASSQQVVLHHVLPMAFSRIITGLLLSIAQVLGEAAPLLLIGSVAFFADVPQDVFDPATLLPVQVYMWSGSVDAGFIEIASAAILVLLLLLIVVNVAVALLRHWLEYKG